MATDAHPDTRLEAPGVNLRAVLLAGCGAMVLLAGAIVGFHAIYRWEVRGSSLPSPAQFPAPRPETNEAAQLHGLLSEQRARLSGYAWADKEHGVVRIPIDRAMKLIVQKGEHAYDPIVPSAPALAAPAAAAQRATTGAQP
jgi:hypothetical protein